MASHHSGNVLAYIGDAVISLYVRDYLIQEGYTRPKDLQKRTIPCVGAKGQASFMQHLLDEKLLTEEEENIFRRGRNANTGAVAKNVDVIVYRIASGYEALIGFLYYQDKARMNEILDLMIAYQF